MGACQKQISLVVFLAQIVRQRVRRHLLGSQVEHLNQHSFRLFDSSSAHSPLSLSCQSETQQLRSLFQTPPIS